MASIEKRGTNSWRLVVEAGTDAKGKRIKRYKSIRVEDKALLRTTKKLDDYLNTELHKFKMEVEAGEYIAPEKMTFGAFVEEWRTKYAVKELSPKTLATHMRFINLRILPVFELKRLDQIKAFHIVQFLSELGEDGNRLDGKDGKLSSGTIHYVYRILKNIFSRAEEWKIIKGNPVADVKRPKVTHKEVEVYDEIEIAALFEALEKEPIHWRMMITMALTTGLRRGELVGLEWKHVNLEKGTIDVKQSIALAVNGEPVITEPKTKKSRRTISLPDSVVDDLKEYKKYIHEQLQNVRDRWKGGEHFFVFCHEDGRPFYPETPYLHFRTFLKKNNLRYIRFHDLRHTSATMLINQGVHAKIIAERLGHASITTTMNVYGHALRSADKEAANKFDKILPLRKTNRN
ncbi:tyrosine-type recombinase/integrase [Brevibacillus reuszeri]|uniref:tyrosine-type recombinase/integrase n=1 Tax=Brevibacillus reuszeri TaxID=54915 RepID=UPI0036717EA1